MIPNVFVSSTVLDLQHLREAIRDAIEELAYNPVMSEYGDVGYLPAASAEQSCYVTVADCQIAVLIIGKQYGSVSENGLSVTHNEFRQARERRIPVICLVGREVMVLKRVYDANPDGKTTFPGMDNPKGTFALVEEFLQSPVNNGILEFENASDARGHLKRQLAHFFGELLRRGLDPVKEGMQDVLSEIKSLRLELVKEAPKKEDLAVLKAIRFLLRDENRWYADLVEEKYGVLERGVVELLKHKTFEEFAEAAGMHLEVVPDDVKPDMSAPAEEGMLRGHFGIISMSLRAAATHITIYRDGRVKLGETAKDHLDHCHLSTLVAADVSFG